MNSIRDFLLHAAEDEIANEGYNMDMAKMIKLESITKARALVADSKMSAKTKNYNDAIASLKAAQRYILEAKTKIAASKEPPNTLSRVLGWITPIFTLLPSADVDSFSNTTTTYTDSMSVGTLSIIKKTLQEKLNLLNHECAQSILIYTAKANKTW